MEYFKLCPTVLKKIDNVSFVAVIAFIRCARYNDLVTISSSIADDKYRVQLQTKLDCSNPSDYINASHLDVS